MFRWRFVTVGLAAAVVGACWQTHLACGDDLQAVYQEDPPSIARVRKALARRLKLSFDKTPLSDAIADLEQRAGIEIELNNWSLYELKVDADSPVTLFGDHSLHAALDKLLAEFGLTFVVDEGFVFITSPQQAARELRLVVYDLQPLLDSVQRDAPAGPTMEKLAQRIKSATQAKAWSGTGGHGRMSAFRNLLVVSQTAAVHAQINARLGQLRGALPPPAEPRIPVGRDHQCGCVRRVSEGERKICRALAKTIDVDFEDAPLLEVTDILESRCKIQIEVDAEVFGDNGVSSDEVVTRKLKGLSLRSVLNVILREFDLTYVIVDDVLLITGEKQAQAMYDSRAYDVRHSLRRGGKNAPDARELTNLIMTLVEPKSWHALCQKSNKTKRNSVTINTDRDSLVVDHHLPAHEQVEELVQRFAVL